MRRTSYFSKINTQESSVALIPDIPKDIQQLRILHSSLVSMEGVSVFKLKILNLSSNHIKRIEGIDHIRSLEQINLSNNKIRVIECMDYLVNLQKLVLFSNEVTSLEGLKQLANNNMNKLKSLDMRGNALNDLNQLQFLTGFSVLEEVMFDVGKASNLMCENKAEYYRQMIRHVKSSVKKIDNRSYSDIEKSMIEPSKISEEKQNRDISNVQETRIADYVRYEVLELEKIISYKDLIIEELKSKNLESTTQLHQNYKDYLKIEHELQKTEAHNEELERRSSKKDKQFQELQHSLNDMMKQNGKLSKDVYNKNLEMERYIKEISDLKMENAEYRAVLKDNERKIHDFHSKTLENVNSNSVKMEEMKKKYQKLYHDHTTIQVENTNLKQRVQQLNEICREWEFKYERAYDEYVHNTEKQLRKLKSEYEKKIQTDQKNHKEEVNSRHLKYKEQLTSVEVQFKAALSELGQKYKKVKKQHEDFSRTDGENKNMLKIALNKNAELEGIIADTQGALERFRKDFMDLMKEKQSLLRQTQQLRHGKTQEVRNLMEQKQKLAYERSYLQRELTNVRQKMTALQFELQSGGKIEQLNTALEVKNQMLEDKNEKIESLKDELNLVRNVENQLQTIRGKYEEKKQKSKQLEKELQNVLIEDQELRDRNEQLEAQLNNTKEELLTKEQNLNKIESYLSQFSSSLKEKQDNIAQLLGIIEQSKGVINRRTEQAEIYKKQAENVKKQFTEKYDFYKSRERKFEQTIENLNHNIQKLEKQKLESQKSMKTAKQYLQNLTKHFNK